MFRGADAVLILSPLFKAALPVAYSFQYSPESRASWPATAALFLAWLSAALALVYNRREVGRSAWNWQACRSAGQKFGTVAKLRKSLRWLASAEVSETVCSRAR
jgi:hypothetical protein